MRELSSRLEIAVKIKLKQQSQFIHYSIHLIKGIFLFSVQRCQLLIFQNSPQ